jgi:hypothetical protein
MLQSIKQLYGNNLVASDGEIGHVKDFYFDERTWAIRYVVADTGSWLPERQVLISPHALSGLRQADKVLRVNLTCKQIENSPSIAPHKPVSRQYEEEYYRYFGWPSYWHGSGLWGTIDFPALEQPAKLLPSASAAVSRPQPGPGDAHLRTTRAVGSYSRDGTDWMKSDVCDYMIDPQSWAIRQVVIKTGRRLSCKEIGIPADRVEQIAWDKSTMCVSLMKESMEPSSALRLAPAGAAD